MSANKSSSRQWVIEPAYDEQGNLLASISQQLAFRLDRLSILMEDVGGTLGVVARREQVSTDPEIFETTSVVVRWESFAPAQRRPREVPTPEPEPEAEVEDSEPESVEEPQPAAA